MRCPACENDVPSGRPTCERCGAPLPSAGGPAAPAPGFVPEPGGSSPTGPLNPGTEPLPIPVWDEGGGPPWHAGEDETPRPREEDRPWNLPWGGPPASAPNPLPPNPLPPDPMSPGPLPPALPPPGPPLSPPPGQDNRTQILGDPWASQVPPGTEFAGWNQGVPPVPVGMYGPAPDGPHVPVPEGMLGPVPGPGADGREKNRKTPLLISGVVAVVVLGGGAAWALTQGLSGPKHSTDTPSAKPGAGGAAQQAAAVNRILKSGSTARGHLPSPLRTCDDVAAGVSGFQQVVQDRQQELAQSKELKVDQLQNGVRLRRSMIAAYQSSLNADRAYLAWAREIQARGCGGKIAPLTAHYKDAIAANNKAGPAKRQVVALWNPIANGDSLPVYVWNRL
jgi:hypothetical protein